LSGDKAAGHETLEYRLGMVEIDFSYIYDFEGDERIWATLMHEFSVKKGIKVNIKRMTWDVAWAELFSYTSLGTGPHVSHIGNTWVGSLARMNALRPFRSDEIAMMGGAWEFVTANWDTGRLPNDRRVWAIPWTSWIYVICFRKDLFEQAGIDPSEAFGTIKSVKETIEHLVASSLDAAWINPKFYVTPSQDIRHVTSRDLMHVAASWIWAAGGDFIDREGTAILFNSPQAIDGIKNWLETYRAVPAKYKRFSQRQSIELFREGRAAAVLTNIYRANRLVNAQELPFDHKNLGIISTTDIPWTGGGSFVVWDHVREDIQKERAAIELVKFLASKENNLRYHREAGSMPARVDALKETYPEGTPAHQAVLWAATKGRGYYTVPAWRRIEHQLSETLGLIVNEATEDQHADLDNLIHTYLDPLVVRLNNTIKI
jgi:multiple sugar transport system substrate-binding protein